MHAQSYRSDRHQPASLSSHSLSTCVPAAYCGGIISEVDYSADHPVTTQLLLPLLQQLGMQSRWLLWLAPQQKLSRLWLEQSGLPLDKVIQPRHLDPLETVDAMEKALLTGNYSVVLCWMAQDLSDAEKVRLHQAAQRGNSCGFIMRPQHDEYAPGRLFSRLKIHSSLYH